MQNNTKVKRNRQKQSQKAHKRSKKPNMNQYLYKGMQKDELILPSRYRVLPPSLVTKLVFMSTLHSPLNNAGLSYATFRLRPSSAFDVDPSIGGTSMPGFNELAATYGRYRMINFKSEVTGVNLDTNAVNLIVFVSNFDLGNNYSQVQSMFGNSFSRYKFLSPAGGLDRATIRTPKWSTAEIVGSEAPLLDTDFSAVVTASPTNNTYLNIGIWTGNATNLVNGVALQVVITAEYRFYEAFHLVTQPDPLQLHPELAFQLTEENRSEKKLR
jgi:hypothetical protein